MHTEQPYYSYFTPSSNSFHYKVVDIAGLVKGAHEGQGLGNAFLSNIKACDAIFHVTRAFDDDDIVCCTTHLSLPYPLTVYVFVVFVLCLLFAWVKG